MDNRNDPAYPCKRMEHVPEYHSQDVKVWGPVDYHGLTKRELIAAMAMQGILSMLSHPDMTVAFSGSAKGEGKGTDQYVAEHALSLADALLAALSAEESK